MTPKDRGLNIGVLIFLPSCHKMFLRPPTEKGWLNLSQTNDYFCIQTFVFKEDKQEKQTKC